MELDELAVTLDGEKIYTCAARDLCARLYNHLKEEQK
jgi:hypothetical protein